MWSQASGQHQQHFAAPSGDGPPATPPGGTGGGADFSVHPAASSHQLAASLLAAAAQLEPQLDTFLWQQSLECWQLHHASADGSNVPADVEGAHQPLNPAPPSVPPPILCGSSCDPHALGQSSSKKPGLVAGRPSVPSKGGISAATTHQHLGQQQEEDVAPGGALISDTTTAISHPAFGIQLMVPTAEVHTAEALDFSEEGEVASHQPTAAVSRNNVEPIRMTPAGSGSTIQEIITPIRSGGGGIPANGMLGGGVSAVQHDGSRFELLNATSAPPSVMATGATSVGQGQPASSTASKQQQQQQQSPARADTCDIEGIMQNQQTPSLSVGVPAVPAVRVVTPAAGGASFANAPNPLLRGVSSVLLQANSGNQRSGGADQLGGSNPSSNTNHILRDEPLLAALHLLFGRALTAAVGIAFYRSEPITLCCVPPPIPPTTSLPSPASNGSVPLPQASIHKGRWFFEVGKYTCIPMKFCSCTSYKYQVIQKREVLMCKHLLAIELLAANVSRGQRLMLLEQLSNNNRNLRAPPAMSLPEFRTPEYYCAVAIGGGTLVYGDASQRSSQLLSGSQGGPLGSGSHQDLAKEWAPGGLMNRGGGGGVNAGLPQGQMDGANSLGDVPVKKVTTAEFVDAWSSTSTTTTTGPVNRM